MMPELKESIVTKIFNFVPKFILKVNPVNENVPIMKQKNY